MNLKEITGTVSIEVEPREGNNDEMVQVYMDWRRVHRPNEDGGAEYEQSVPYYKAVRQRKLGINLTPYDLARLEDKVHDAANGVTEANQ